MTEHTYPRTRRSRVRRFFAGLLTLVGLAIALVGGWGDGYLTTPKGDLATPTSAMVTREIEVSKRLPADPNPDLGELATVRIRATPAEATKAIFIGIAKRSDVMHYLSGSAYDEMATYQEKPFHVVFTRSAGSGTPPPPAAQKIWVAHASGPGTQTLAWDKTHGEWMAVVMNADGSPGVAVSADVGLRFGWLVPLGLGIAALGLLVFFLPRRSPHTTTPAPPPVHRTVLAGASPTHRPKDGN